MTFKIPDAAEFGLTVGGVDMKVGADLLQNITIIENTHSLIPSVNLTIIDDKKKATSFGAFSDGSDIGITIGDGKIDPRQYKFKHWSMDSAIAAAAGSIVTLNGMADIVPWFSKVIDRHYEGTSSDVISQVAQANGLKVDVDSTSDKMVWMPDNRAIYQWARKVADHSWNGSGSSMFLAVTSDQGNWQARFKDIMKDGGSNTTKFASIGINGSGDIPIWDYRIKSKTGAMNRTANYGLKVLQEKLDGNINLVDAFSFVKNVASVGINSDLAKSVGTAMASFMAPDVGNTHKNYAEALHHNTRAKATYSTIVMIQTDRLSNVKLLDDVEISLAMSDGTIDSAYSGKYKVTAIARHIGKKSYTEKLELSSQGVGASVFGGMV